MSSTTSAVPFSSAPSCTSIVDVTADDALATTLTLARSGLPSGDWSLSLRSVFDRMSIWAAAVSNPGTPIRRVT